MGIAQDIIADARSYAHDSVSAATGWLGMATALAGQTPILTKPELARAELDLKSLDQAKQGPLAKVPEFKGSFESPGNPAESPEFETPYLPALPELPEPPAALDISALFKTAKPDADVGPFAEKAPAIRTEYDYPDAPELVFPAVPELREFTVEAAPEVTLPEYDNPFEAKAPAVPNPVPQLRIDLKETAPVFQAFLESGVDAWLAAYAPEYKTSLARLEAKLARDMAGGHALSDEVEQAIFDRARQRIERETEGNKRELIMAAGRRGHVYPPGSLNAGLNQLTLEASNRVAQSATETAIERAKLEIQHVQFIIQASGTLVQAAQNAFVQYAGTLVQINGQALDYSTKIAAIAVDVFNGALGVYRAEIEVFQAQAAVYETALKAALAELDVYRLTLETGKVISELNDGDVRRYAAVNAAVGTRIEAYRSELEAIKTQAEIERNKIELFQQQVQAYVGQVQAKSAEFECYKAAISGDAGLVDAYAGVVASYRAQVEAGSTVANVDIAHSKAVGDYNATLIGRYSADLEAYRTVIGAEEARYNADVGVYRQVIEAYKTDLQVRLAQIGTTVGLARLDLDAARTQFDGEVRMELAQAELFTRGVEVQANSAVAAGKVAGDIAQSAVGATNTLAALDESAKGA